VPASGGTPATGRQFLLNLGAFWLLDWRRLHSLYAVIAGLLAGLVLLCAGLGGRGVWMAAVSGWLRSGWLRSRTT
jgi:hypothetical protein